VITRLLVLLIALPALAAEPVRIGVLHSLTGTMAISERSLIDAVQLAVDEVNAGGGVLGRRLEILIEDGASDPATFAKKAERLIVRDRVASLFGCWTSSSRKAVLPVVEKLDHLLWYPLQYEGLEASKNVIYTGAAPNQQILPAVEWALKRFGKRAFLVGSDYVFPRTAHRIVRAQLERAGGSCVAEEYRPLGSTDFAGIVARLKATDPDFVLNTINGDSNVAFFTELAKAGLGPYQVPVISVSMAEDELRLIGGALAVDHYAAWSYFQSVDSPANRRFVAAFKNRYGPDRVTDDPIEAAYVAVHFFARAVAKAGAVDVAAIREAARGLELEAPGGRYTIDRDTQHTWKVARVGQIEADGQFRVVWSSGAALKPEPFPALLSH
jgi:urea transport system substrate-binding protein